MEWYFTFNLLFFSIFVTNNEQGDLREDVKQWVYDVVDSLLPVCKGVYSVDLGAHGTSIFLFIFFLFSSKIIQSTTTNYWLGMLLALISRKFTTSNKILIHVIY